MNGKRSRLGVEIEPKELNHFEIAELASTSVSVADLSQRRTGSKASGSVLGLIRWASKQREMREETLMKSDVLTVKAYLESLPDDRRAALSKVRAVIRKNLPRGFEEGVQFGMVGYYLPLSIYPDTYNKAPLSLAALASQKQHMAVYLMGMYGDPATEKWFKTAWAATGKKLDMGKSCLRFKKLEDLSLEVLGEVIARVSPEELIRRYEASHPKKGK